MIHTALIVLAVIATAYCGDYWIELNAKSVNSDLYKPLREGKEPVTIDQCGKDVTEPYGILEHKYKRQESENSLKCTWKLHAPADHVINVPLVSFRMENELNLTANTKAPVSTITLYDGPESNQDKLLTRYFVSRFEKIGNFTRSQSSGRDMVVEIEYHDSEDFENQQMKITYEFLDSQKAKALEKH